MKVELLIAVLLLLSTNVLAGVTNPAVKSIAQGITEKTYRSLLGKLSKTNSYQYSADPYDVFFKELDEILNLDADAISSMLNFQLDAVVNSHKDIEIPVYPLVIPFNLEIPHIDFDGFFGYFGAYNGKIKLAAIKKPSNIAATKTENGELVISYDISLEDLVIDYSSVFIYFLGNYNKGSVRIDIPSIYYKTNITFGSHSANCVDIEFEDESTVFSGIEVHVEPRTEDFLSPRWIESALIYLRQYLENHITMWRDDDLEYISCARQQQPE